MCRRKMMMGKEESMRAACVSKEEKNRVENFLNGYGMNAAYVRMDRYERQFMRDLAKNSEGDVPVDMPLAKAKMFEVRHFILELENSDEKLFLYYRYVKRYTVERCGELFGVSRRTAYRMLDRALRLAYENGVGKYF